MLLNTLLRRAVLILTQNARHVGLALVLVGLNLTTTQCTADETNQITLEAKAIGEKLIAKISAGQTSKEDLAPVLQEYDQLLARHAGDKSEALAEALLTEGTIYDRILREETKGEELYQKLLKEFPDSKAAKQRKEAVFNAKNDGLPNGTQFPDFAESDLNGKPLALASFKGKVVLVDFWATWCGPCKAELPNVLQTYEKYRAQGFEVVGISLDKDASALTDYVAKSKLPWPQFFDGQGWKNKLAVKCNIHSIPATYLLDGTGKIIGKDLRGHELEEAVAAALAKP